MKKIRLLTLVIVICAVILLGCSPSPSSIPTSKISTPTLTAEPTTPPTAVLPTPTPSFSQIQFNVDNIAKLPGERFSLNLSGITTVDSNELFIYGSLNSVSQGWKKSVILKSVDQGLSWEEIFEPINSNSIMFVSFIDKNQGWLLCAWTVEDISDLKLYKTFDGGKNWSFVSKIPMLHWYGFPSRMQFITPDYGKMEFVYIGGAPGTDKISFMSTSDGGITWSEDSSLPTASQRFSVYDGYIHTVPPQFTTFGTDDSIWMLNDQRVTGSFYKLQVLMPNSAEWQHSSMIADDYTFNNGQVSITK